MGHMLRTVNPEAADAIDNPAAPPDVGTWVVFKGRAGFSRMRRTEFPALVLGSLEDGTVQLMVVMEPEDMMMEDRVPFRSHNQEAFYWRHVEKPDAEVINQGPDLTAIVTRLHDIEQVLMSDEMEALEKRIVALEKAAKPKAAKKGK